MRPRKIQKAESGRLCSEKSILHDSVGIQLFSSALRAIRIHRIGKNRPMMALEEGGHGSMYALMDQSRSPALERGTPDHFRYKMAVL
jgi:hypothetical protein